MRPAATLLLTLLLFIIPAMAVRPAVTRLEFVTALWEGAGAVPYDAATPFSDLPCSTALAWAYDLGITAGTGGDTFSPDRPITREEAAVLLRRYAEVLGRDTFIPSGLSECNDNEGISPWADDSLYWATDCGLIDWSPAGLLDPHGALSRPQLEAVLSRFFDLSIPQCSQSA